MDLTLFNLLNLFSKPPAYTKFMEGIHYNSVLEN